MSLDELGMDAGEIDLAKVDGRAGMVEAPGDDGQQSRPLLGQLQSTERAPGQPSGQFGPALADQGEKRGKPLRLPEPADQSEGIFQAVDPDLRGDFIDPEDTMVDGAPFDPVGAGGRRDPGDPITDLGKPFAQLPRVKDLQSLQTETGQAIIGHEFQFKALTHRRPPMAPPAAFGPP